MLRSEFLRVRWGVNPIRPEASVGGRGPTAVVGRAGLQRVWGDRLGAPAVVSTGAPPQVPRPERRPLRHCSGTPFSVGVTCRSRSLRE